MQAVKASPAAVPSTASTLGGAARATSSPSSSSTAPSAPERERGQARSLGQRVELVAVDDDEVGAAEDLHRHGLRRRRVEREESRRRTRGSRNCLHRDLELAEEVLDRPGGRDRGVRPGRDDDLRLPVCVDVDERDAGRLDRMRQVVVDSRLVDALQGLLGERVLSDGADHPHVGPEPGGGDGLVRTLAAREALEARVGDGLAGLRQTLATGDEVEVDRCRRR